MDETTTKRRQDSVAHYLRFASGPWQCRFGTNVQTALDRIKGNKKTADGGNRQRPEK